MSREILFRGRRVFVPNEWVYGNLLTDFERHDDRDGKRITAIAYFEGFQKIAEIDPATVGQFTGLLDRDGKKVFEGDIVRLMYPMNHGFGGVHKYEKIVKIEWQSGGFWFRGDGVTDTNWHFYNAEDREVIGNIHENPELVTEAK